MAKHPVLTQGLSSELKSQGSFGVCASVQVSQDSAVP